MASWFDLPNEIRLEILEALLRDGCRVAKFATVSQEWQAFFEERNFARIKLTTSRLANFKSITYRKRHLVRYIWLCVELEPYDYNEAVFTSSSSSLSSGENARVIGTIRKLISDLKTWEPNGELMLDISVHSPSDSKYLLKYLTFEPDTHANDGSSRSSAHERDRELGNHWREWVFMRPFSHRRPIIRTFKTIRVVDHASEVDGATKWKNRLWRVQPSVPAVTSILLRQQTRRQWSPTTLGMILGCFPSLQEVFYEPWRRLGDNLQEEADQDYASLFQLLASQKIRKLVVFENSNPYYSRVIPGLRRPRIPTTALSRTTAEVSLKLEELSASFLVDASSFFYFCGSSYKWDSLKSLTLTSKLLKPRALPSQIDDMLISAAAAAMEMPQLQTMELWNGRAGLAALVKYQSRYAALIWRGTWDFTLRPLVIQAWENVARKHGARGLVVHKELLEWCITSHGDAIHHLGLSNPVVRPTSLQQIRTEHNVHRIWEKMRRKRESPDIEDSHGEEMDSEDSYSEEMDSDESDSEEMDSDEPVSEDVIMEQMIEEMESDTTDLEELYSG